MTFSLFTVALFVVVIVLIPFAVKWIKRRSAFAGKGAFDVSRLVSAVAVGAHQRVVTVEVGPAHARVWLTLGVTPSAINCLHTSSLLQAEPRVAADSPEQSLIEKWNESRL